MIEDNMNNNSQNVSQVLARFRRVYLGDSLIQRIAIDMVHAQITFLCTSALILKDSQNADIFNPEQRHQPAQMTFEGVKSIACPEGRFYLNSTIVDFDAKPADDEGLIDFRIEMTGGFDNDSFMRSLIIVARDFSLATAQ
jgi:hypothetical protein